MNKKIINKVYIVLGLLIILITIGYSAFEKNFNLNNILAEIRPKKDIRITGINIDSTTNNAISNYEDYNHNSLFIGLNLPNNDSSIKYKVEVTNIESAYMGIYDITGFPDNLTYELNEYDLKTTICNNENKCNLGIKKEFYITIKYKENATITNENIDINLFVDFREMYSIEYVDIENNNYPDSVIHGGDLKIEFINDIPGNLLVCMNDSIISSTDFSYINSILKIENVTGNIKIEKMIDKTGPVVELTQTLNENIVTISLNASDDAGIKEEYSWSVSTSDDCNEDTTFTTSSETSYSYEITTSGNYFVCTKVEDNNSNITYKSELLNGSYNNYSETTEHEYIIPQSGYYKLEVWGAQGGKASTISGGYGGYSTGIVYLDKGETLYINVGGQGENGVASENITTSGGYNGGGDGYVGSAAYPVSGGGGATHIAKESGLLSSLSSYAGNHNSPILIVAGGGAGVAKLDSSAKTNTIGHAGGYVGNNSKGRKDNGTETTSDGGTQIGVGVVGTYIGTFGQGTSYKSSGKPGGGGGYYGGNGTAYAAGGGSGYIGNTQLTNKVMYCYNCSISNGYSTKTISTTNVSDSPISQYAKSSNGYAKITYVNNSIDLETFTVNSHEEFIYGNVEQTYNIPKTGYYKLEAWGAQGGSAGSISGGYGGYSTGTMYLNKGETLYINVGGQGENGVASENITTSGGYNGGGDGYVGSAAYPVSGGGGATHIAKESGLLSSLSSYAGNHNSPILIVAGGGGGVAKLSSTAKTNTVGHAGGYIGNTSKGKTDGGTATTADGGTQIGVGVVGTYIGTFGQGTSYKSSGKPGGGGGYYGGNGTAYAAGGGSGYIASTLVTNKVMYCYNCSTSDDESTRTISSTNVNETATSNYSKKGNGFAQITYIDDDIFTISYNLDGGSLEEGKTNPTEYTKKSNDIILNNPTKIGYTFLGWTGSNGEVPETSVIIPSGSILEKSYTANWQANEYAITYNYNNNDNIVAGKYVDTGLKVDWDNDFEITATINIPSIGNRHLIVGNYNNSDTKALNFEITAKGALRTFFGTGSVDYSTGTITASEDIVVKFKWIAETDSYTMSAIGETTNINYSNSYSMSGTSTYTLRYGASDYRSATSPFSDINIKSLNIKKLYKNINDIVLPEITRTGYTFNGWYTSMGEGTLIDTNEKIPSTNSNIYANWKENTLTIVYHTNGATSIAYQGKSMTEEELVSGINPIYYYHTMYSEGMLHPQNTEYLYLKKSNYYPTKYWLIDSATSTSKISESFGGTGAQIAEEMGKSIETESIVVHVYAQWIEPYIYKSGTINTALVGGLTAYAYRPSTSESTVKKPTVTLGSSSITLSLAHIDPGSAGTYFTNNKVDLNGYTTLKITVSSASVGTTGGYVRFGVTSTKANNYVVDKALTIAKDGSESVSNQTFSIDISSLNESYYLFINLYGAYDKQITFTKWWLE